jgi:hypothetical protein
VLIWPPNRINARNSNKATPSPVARRTSPTADRRQHQHMYFTVTVPLRPWRSLSGHSPVSLGSSRPSVQGAPDARRGVHSAGGPVTAIPVPIHSSIPECTRSCLRISTGTASPGDRECIEVIDLVGLRPRVRGNRRSRRVLITPPRGRGSLQPHPFDV